MLDIDAPNLAQTATPRNFSLGLAPFHFADLFTADGLHRLHTAFEQALAQSDPPMAEAHAAWRDGAQLSAKAESELLIGLAQHLGPFVARLFAVGPQALILRDQVSRHQLVFTFKRDFVGKRIRRRKSATPPDAAAYEKLETLLGGTGDAETRAARCAMTILNLYQVADHRPAPTPEALAEAAAHVTAMVGYRVAPENTKTELLALLDIVEAWHAPRLETVPWVSYHQPAPIDPTHQALVHLTRPNAALPEALQGPASHTRQRQGFGLTDKRMDARHIDNEVDYCLLCHVRGKDSCRHGLLDKLGTPKNTPLGTPLTGCPLDERISETHVLRGQGNLIAALAMITVDNPMCAGTGHRICNDCMKACIFQKQEPVNIPEVETSVLTDVLGLPFGFEIYSLLTRFNPLNKRRPYPAPYNGKKALVVGLGPAGYTLAHYLINEGFGVVGIDGLKIEPLPKALTGADQWPPQALEHYRDIEDKLDSRILGGFGGVAEYGITVRWDKNFLKVIYLTLARRQQFTFFGGIRFGSTVSLEEAWEMGFDHVAIAAGAGRPTVVDIKNNMLRGMRAASDFLMGLQLTGAFKQDSMANLQVELPAIVVGGGLTAVDTATEIAAYYPVQVEKLLQRVEALGEAVVISRCDPEEHAILRRMLDHAKALREERRKASPNIQALIQSWGGVSVAYRRGLVDSPAYRLNHEEVQKALEEGISFIEHMTPTEAVQDTFGHIEALRCRRADGTFVDLPARAVMVAAGTTPNTIYEREVPGTFKLDGRGKFFAPHRLDWTNVNAPRLVPAQMRDKDAFFTSYDGGDRRFVSYYGDNHPRYAGNVVRAMASAKDGFAHVARLFAEAQAPKDLSGWTAFCKTIRTAWQARVVCVNRLTPTIVEIVVHAPSQARKFAPGQFYRLQNFEATSPMLGAQRLTMEGLALTGAWVDKDKGLLGMIALEMGVSSRLCAMLKPDEEIVLMGPTGTPTEIPTGETVLLCGGGLGNAVLFSVARALKDNGNRVLYFAGYRRASDLYKQDEVEAGCDQVIWSVDAGEQPQARRPQDRSFVGNIVQAMQAYATGEMAEPVFDLKQVDRILAIGSDRMMSAVTTARKTVLAEHLNPKHQAIASINSPMQCMMKEVCAQCLQRHIDPITGEESFVFSCFNQDQPQDTTDWKHLAARLRQNTVLEKVTNLYLDHVLAQSPAQNTDHPQA